MKSTSKIIFFLFSILFFLVPLILWPNTSELFEFNKMIVVYLVTTLISGAWIIRMITEKRLIFRRTILDIPLLLFFASQLLSTILSIDPQTSWFGYYSRFNGGLLSTICYLLLYWAFVSNIKKKDTYKLINTILWSGVLLSIYGVLERMGIDKTLWVQDVQHRVFSTLGQPNWLAAWLIAVIPLTWVLFIKEESSLLSIKSLTPLLMSALFFAVLLFTGSRSGLAGFGVIEIVFLLLLFFKYKFKYVKKIIIINIILVVFALINGTQFTPSFIKYFTKNSNATPTASTQTGSTALETGGTESGSIRKIVWQGAIDIWKHYPVFGTGVETYAFSYYLYRPAAHNMTSEWDFIYNKAHNEYLNFMANTGTVGIVSYLIMVAIAFYIITKNYINKDNNSDTTPLISIALITGYVSILVTNFFGFSVVPVQILFYLYPAFSIIIVSEDKIIKETSIELNTNRKIPVYITGATTLFILTLICRYWYADVLYARGINLRKSNRPDLAVPYLNRAVNLEPKQSLYYSELSQDYVSLAVAYNQAKQASMSAQLTEAAIESSIKSVELNPANVNLKRNEVGVFIILSSIDPNYLLDARDVLEVAVKQAPTDAKLYYNLGLVYSRTGQNDLAIEALKKTVDLKANYKDARLALAILLIDNGNKAEAKKQLEYILTNIDPTDSMSKQYLETIK